MKKFLTIGLMTAGLLGWRGIAHADTNLTGNINVSIGQKFLSDDWKDDDSNIDLTDQFELGLLMDMRPKPWPINIALDLLGSSKKDNGITGSTSEFALGVRKYFMEATNVQPFIGGGLASVMAKESVEVRGSEVSVDDSALGIWLMGGVQFRPMPHVNLGMNVRYSQATVQFFDKDVDAGGIHYGLFAGYAF